MNDSTAIDPPDVASERVAAVGVRRASTGGAFAGAAYGALVRAAQELLADGTSTYAIDGRSEPHPSSLFASRRRGSAAHLEAFTPAHRRPGILRSWPSNSTSSIRRGVTSASPTDTPCTATGTGTRCSTVCWS